MNIQPLRLTLFGGFAVSHGGTPITAFRTDKIRALLAYLAVEADRPHRRETLATLFWWEMADSVAKRNLRQSLYRLKKSVPLPDDWLLQTRQTVQLNSRYLECDVRMADAAFSACERHTHHDLQGCVECRERLVEATSLYDGELLQGIHIDDAFGFVEWQSVQRERFHQQQLGALRLLTDAWLQDGAFDNALQTAQKQLALEGWREIAHRQVMAAYAGLGQLNALTAQFERCRAVLWEELGVEPSTETQTHYESLLENAHVPPIPTVRTRLHNFPLQLTPFIGRKSDLDTAFTYLAEPTCRLLTICGVGGLGKTRLTLQLAEQISTTTRFPDGIYFVPLAATSQPEQVATAIGLVLGLTFAADAEPETQLLTFLQPRNCLLLLDNFEHLTAAKQLLLKILRAAPQVVILQSSRETLNLHGEQRLPLAGLDIHDGVELFARSARRTLPRFAISAENEPHIQQICTLTDGLPLAIEMAASWTRLLTCQQIADQLATHAATFLEERADLPARHTSMRAVFDHSWQLLSDSERTLLTQFAIFEDGATHDALQAVTAAQLGDVANLLDKSLLMTDRNRRYAMHTLLRQFARERLDSAETLQSKHATYFMHFLAARCAAIKGGDQRRALDEIAADLRNIEMAWQFAIAQRDISLLDQGVEGLAHFCDTRSRFRLGKRLLQAALDIVPESNPTYARIAARLGWFHFHLGQVARGNALLVASLQLLENVQSKDAVFAHNYTAAIARHQNETATAKAHLQAAQQLAEIIGDQYGLSIAQNILGQIALLEEDYAAARSYCQRSLQLKREIGDEWGMTFSHGYLGRIDCQVGAYDSAENHFNECLTLSQKFGDRRMVAFALENLGNVAAARDIASTAQTYWQQAHSLYAEIGSQRDVKRVAALLR